MFYVIKRCRTAPDHSYMNILHSYFSRRTALLALLVIPVFCFGNVRAQNVQYSIANEFRYGNGERYQNDEAENTEYFENLLNSRVYIGDFLVGFRVEVDKPRELGLGPDTVGLTQYFAEFSRDGVSARAGTFYKLVGHGLLFNTFESRPIGFNTQTNGLELDYNSREFSAGAFGGAMSYNDILQADRVEDYDVRAGWGEVRPISEISIGGSFVTAEGKRTRSGFRNAFDAYMRETFIEANYEGFNAVYNWGDKRTTIDEDTDESLTSVGYGTGMYSKLGYTGSVFSLTGEFKDYRFDLVPPEDVTNPTRHTRALPFQNAPTLIPEHDKTLLARNPHAIDFSDELGFQASGFVYPNEKLTVSFAATAGSRHQAWDTSSVFDEESGEQSLRYTLVDDKRLSFPELTDWRYSPYWEVFVQGDYELNEDISLAAALQLKDNITYYDPVSLGAPSNVEAYKATTVMAEGIVALTSNSSLHGIVEGQRVYDSKKVIVDDGSDSVKPFDGKFYNMLFTLEYSRSPNWSVNGRLEWSSSDKEQEGRQIWPVVGGTYRIGRAHTISAQYGWERGGVVCTGGVCRFINPFTGFRLTVTSKL